MQIDVRALTCTVDDVQPVPGFELKSDLNQGFTHPEAAQVRTNGSETNKRRDR